MELSIIDSLIQKLPAVSYTYRVRPSKLIPSSFNASLALLKTVEVAPLTFDDQNKWETHHKFVPILHHNIAMDAARYAPTPNHIKNMGETSLGLHEERRRVHVDTAVSLAFKNLENNSVTSLDVASRFMNSSQVNTQTSFMRYNKLFTVCGLADKAFYCAKPISPFIVEEALTMPRENRSAALAMIQGADYFWNNFPTAPTKKDWEAANHEPIYRKQGRNPAWLLDSLGPLINCANVYVDYKSETAGSATQLLWYQFTSALTSHLLNAQSLPIMNFGVMSDAASYFIVMGFVLRNTDLSNDSGETNFVWFRKFILDESPTSFNEPIAYLSSHLEYVFNSTCAIEFPSNLPMPLITKKPVNNK